MVGAGNRVIIKPSEYTPEASKVIKDSARLDVFARRVKAA